MKVPEHMWFGPQQVIRVVDAGLFSHSGRQEGIPTIPQVPCVHRPRFALYEQAQVPEGDVGRLGGPVDGQGAAAAR